MLSLGLRFTDADLYPDYLDIDADDDGIPDNIEGQSTAGYLLPGTTDTDGDGLVNTYDNAAGYGGSGIFVYDHDADGLHDYRDTDTDADGLPDIVEGNDFNLNGSADDNVTLTGLDADGDGLDDRFDSLSSVINIKGTSYRMGNGGSFTGDATPGSRTTVQRTMLSQSDRDWRFVGYILPARFLNFSGMLKSNTAILDWTIIADKEVARFEIERSTNNISFTKVNTVRQNVLLNVQQSFSSSDNIAGVNSDIIYYRLKVIGKAGEISYSNILVLRSAQSLNILSILPNPASNDVVINFYAVKNCEVFIRLISSEGKLMEQQTVIAFKGRNQIPLTRLSKYSDGVYTLQAFTNGEVFSEKLILIH